MWLAAAIAMTVISRALAWPDMAGSCFNADAGHNKRLDGTGGFTLVLERQRVQHSARGLASAIASADDDHSDGPSATATHIDVLLRLVDTADAAPLRGYVVKLERGSGAIFPVETLPADAQHIDCRDGGDAKEAVTHTSRSPKQAVELIARVPMSSITCNDPDPDHNTDTVARGVLLQVIAMPEFSAWFKFRQRLVCMPDTEPLRLELTEAVAVSAAEDSVDAERDGLTRDNVHEL